MAKSFVFKIQRILPFPIVKTSWGKNLEESSTSISELRKDFYLIFSLELCLKSIFLGENYATRPMASENDKNRKEIFSLHIFPRLCIHIPGDREIRDSTDREDIGDCDFQ